MKLQVWRKSWARTAAGTGCRGWEKGSFRLLDTLDFKVWAHCDRKCLQLSWTLSTFGLWQECAIFYLLDHHVLTKTLALIGGPVNKDFGRDDMAKGDKHLEDLRVRELLGQVVDEDIAAVRAWVAAETRGRVQ